MLLLRVMKRPRPHREIAAVAWNVWMRTPSRGATNDHGGWSSQTPSLKQRLVLLLDRDERGEGGSNAKEAQAQAGARTAERKGF